MISLSRWLDRHEVDIDRLGQEDVADACREATWDELKHDATIQYIQNNTWEVVDDLISELPDLNPAEALKAIEHIVKEKYKGDWRAVIKEIAMDEDDYEDMEKPLRLIGEEHMFDPNTRNFLDFVDWDDFAETFENDLEEYFEKNIDNLIDEEWFIEWVYGGHDGDVEDYITPDDYYPIWSYAYEFPACDSAEILNEEMAGIGLIFFELNGVTYVSLAVAGMSMMPALYYAYYVYSDLDIDPEEIANEIVRHGPSYWKYVIGSERLLELTERIGYDLKELQRISEQKYKEFDETLKALSEEVKKGKMDRLEAGLLGMMEALREPDINPAKTP